MGMVLAKWLSPVTYCLSNHIIFQSLWIVTHHAKISR
jgi:hypothetical protein